MNSYPASDPIPSDRGRGEGSPHITEEPSIATAFNSAVDAGLATYRSAESNDREAIAMKHITGALIAAIDRGERHPKVLRAIAVRQAEDFLHLSGG